MLHIEGEESEGVISYSLKNFIEFEFNFMQILELPFLFDVSFITDPIQEHLFKSASFTLGFHKNPSIYKVRQGKLKKKKNIAKNNL